MQRSHTVSPSPALQSAAAARVAIVLTLLSVAMTTPGAHGGVVSAEVLAPPDYSTLLPPRAGRAYLDPVFQTAVLRVSDAAATEDFLDGGGLEYVMHEYSTISPFNSGTTRMLLLHESVFALYDTRGRLLQVLPADVHAGSEPRWSLQDSNVFFFVNGNELRRYHIDTGEIALVRRFDEYAVIGGRGESDLSSDGGHLALVGDDREIFLYAWSTDTLGAALDTSLLGTFDQVMVTPDNHVLVGWHAVGPERAQGLELYDGNMAFIKQVSQAGGHMDVGRDFDGAQMVVRGNAADPEAICPNGVVKIRLGDDVQTCLISLDWSLAMHVSVADLGPWVFISTFAPGDPTPDDGWTLYTNEILQVKLDGSEVRRLAHHRSRPFNDYSYQPRAAVSRDGTRVLYTSNFSLQSIIGFGSDYSEVFLISADSGRKRRHRPTG